MFNLFRKKSKLEVLQDKHQKLLEDAFRLSKINRTESDLKYAEAAKVEQEITELEKAQQ